MFLTPDMLLSFIKQNLDAKVKCKEDKRHASVNMPIEHNVLVNFFLENIFFKSQDLLKFTFKVWYCTLKRNCNKADDLKIFDCRINAKKIIKSCANEHSIEMNGTTKCLSSETRNDELFFIIKKALPWNSFESELTCYWPYQPTK